MKVTSANNVKVYTVSGDSERPLPEWLIRQKKRQLRNDAGTSRP
jgi:ribosome biogenesis protein ENP2